MIWWILGVPVLWLRQLMCRAGLHVDETDCMGGTSPVCLRCGTEFEDS